jgi:hypothetical protein
MRSPPLFLGLLMDLPQRNKIFACISCLFKEWLKYLDPANLSYSLHAIKCSFAACSKRLLLCWLHRNDIVWGVAGTCSTLFGKSYGLSRTNGTVVTCNCMWELHLGRWSFRPWGKSELVRKWPEICSLRFQSRDIARMDSMKLWDALFEAL